ncbi:peptidase S16 [Skermania sp. ID1734]|uniref:LON peptidase substrate-binding domain-containing protein n=1 Tax=Skermania sp. ID1734 TaxID=2597516 RepID=UPI00117C1C03|nr:LON peptidase substrate-binding domain-containing protein [Skermania sp. ID1734]TSD97215.1 peptidase S16 [Skermania sp. ID1734]
MDQMPMFPLGTVLLPGERLPLQIFEPRYVALVQACLAAPTGPEFGVVLIARGHEVGGGEQRTDLGTIARIDDCVSYSDSRYILRCTGTDRIRVQQWLPDDPYPRAEVQRWPAGTAVPSDAAVAEVLDRAEEIAALHSQLAKRAGQQIPRYSRPRPQKDGRIAYSLASQLPLSDADRQAVLAAADPEAQLLVLAAALDDVIAALRFRLL